MGCEALPAAGCRLAQPGKSVLLLKNGSGAKDKLKWAFKRGDETFVDAFMDPVAGLSEYSLCVYDSAASEQPLARQDIPAGGDCGGRPCWNLSGGRTLSFKDKTGTAADGITDVKLLAGDAARSQVIVKGVGQALGLPDLGLTLPVTVQLVASQDGQTECWQTTYSQAAKNKTKLFRAKGP